jgi:uncharacterized protein (TIGR03083 family)
MGLDHLALLRDDLDRFATAVEYGPADAPIAGCPGWDLHRLGLHLAGVHRWVLAALELGAAPRPDQLPPDPEGDLAAVGAYVREGSARLLEALHDVDPDAPTWHPFPVEPKLAGLWRRRQAQEASVHRWDAERAIGGTPTIEAAFAADGADEYWHVMLPRMLIREGRATPSTRIATVALDTGQRWCVDGASGMPVAIGDADEADVVLESTAETLLLRLWGRPCGEVLIRGDADAAAAWLALGGA